MSKLTNSDFGRIKKSVIRSENTPTMRNKTLPAIARNPRHSEYESWAYNTTGYELQPGYIVAVTAYDPDNQKYTISRPTADDMPNIAVVDTYCPNSSTATVSLQFSGDALLWYSGTAPTVSVTLGSQANSFYAKIGSNGFAPLETGSAFSGFGRCRSRFFNLGKSIDQKRLYLPTPTIDITRQYTNETITHGKLDVSFMFKKDKIYTIAQIASPYCEINFTNNTGCNITSINMYYYDSSDNIISGAIVGAGSLYYGSGDNTTYLRATVPIVINIRPSLSSDTEAVKMNLVLTGVYAGVGSSINILNNSFLVHEIDA